MSGKISGKPLESLLAGTEIGQINMCGFMVIWDKQQSNLRDDEFKNKLAQLVYGIHSHRGPDSSNVKVLENWIFSFDRLQITGDAVEGVQPFTTDDHKIMCFNGEIYNYLDLARGLELEAGVLSDTRVLYEVFSKQEIFPEFRSVIFGQYAVAVSDTLNNTIDLFRDPYGEKPLYYFDNEEIAIISSELHSLKKVLVFLGIPIEIDAEQLAFFLSTGFCSAPKTLVKGIHQVNPGHHIRLTTSNHEIVTSNSISDRFVKKSVVSDLDEVSFEEIFMPFFTKICQEYFIADSQIGIFFSGGIDSSLISLVAKQSSTPFSAHTIGFPNTEFDESSAAMAIAQKLQFELNLHPMREEDALAELQSLIRNPMDPIGDASILPTRFLSRMVSKSHKVAIGGDGADELFAGYHRMHQYIKHLEKSEFKPYLDLYGKPHETAELLEVALDDIYRNVENNLLPIHSKQSLRQYEIRGYLSNNILHKVDRSSMAFGLEVRSPFLDERLIGLLSSVNVFHNSTEHSNKYVVRKYLSKYIKSAEAFRPKMGFTPPLALWLRRSLSQTFSEVIRDFDWQKINMNSSKVMNIMNDFFEGDDDKLTSIWELFMLANFFKETI